MFYEFYRISKVMIVELCVVRIFLDNDMISKAILDNSAHKHFLFLWKKLTELHKRVQGECSLLSSWLYYLNDYRDYFLMIYM